MQNNRRDDRQIQGQALQHGLGTCYTCSHTIGYEGERRSYSVQPHGAPRLMEKTDVSKPFQLNMRLAWTENGRQSLASLGAEG